MRIDLVSFVNHDMHDIQCYLGSTRFAALSRYMCIDCLSSQARTRTTCVVLGIEGRCCHQSWTPRGRYFSQSFFKYSPNLRRWCRRYWNCAWVNLWGMDLVSKNSASPENTKLKRNLAIFNNKKPIWTRSGAFIYIKQWRVTDLWQIEQDQPFPLVCTYVKRALVGATVVDGLEPKLRGCKYWHDHDSEYDFDKQNSGMTFGYIVHFFVKKNNLALTRCVSMSV